MPVVLSTANVLGLPVHTGPDTVGCLIERINQGQGGQVVTLNAEMAMQADREPELAAVIRQALLTIPDGIGVVGYLQLRGQRVQRLPGIELAEVLIQEAAQRGWKVFFYGGEPDVAAEAARHWHHRFPQLCFSGVWHGYLSGSEENTMLRSLQTEAPQLILVGLGVPRQEYWIAKHLQLAPHAVWMGVGGSFDIWSGRKERAPQWLQRWGLEWTWRLYQEPWRWRRMLALPQFLLRALLPRPKRKKGRP
jgi:N-acetylglucosaminyldiphosphoundecaprenol N-acetyl-beta-D-mannosaminyltransferase